MFIVSSIRFKDLHFECNKLMLLYSMADLETKFWVNKIFKGVSCILKKK